MKRRWYALLFLAALVGLSGQRADASRTPLADVRASITQPHQITAATASTDVPADAWIVESIIPLGTTADGQPLALISLLVPLSSLDELPPASTRAGPYAAPKTHTRVFCIVQPPLGLWHEGGHYYTVLIVGLAAGYSVEEAKELAFFSEYPDYVREYNATTGLRGDRSYGKILRNDLSDDSLLMQEIGHSLRGVAAHGPREIFKRNWSSLGTLAERGIALHAFGDLYAHARDVGGVETLYPPGTGHASEGTAPDQIGLNYGRYEQYVRAMYTMIKKEGADDRMIEQLLSLTKGMSVESWQANRGRFTFYEYDASSEQLMASRHRHRDKGREVSSMRAIAEWRLSQRGSSTLPPFDPGDTKSLHKVRKKSAGHYGIRDADDLMRERQHLDLLRRIQAWQ